MRRLAKLFLWLFAFSIPWENSVTIEGFGTVTRVVGALALGVGAAFIARRGTLRNMGPTFMLLAGFFAWSCASITWSVDPEETVIIVITAAQLLLMAGLIIQLVETEDECISLCRAYVLGALVSVYGTYLSYTRGAAPAGVETRYAAKGFDPNDLALAMVLAVPLSYHLATIAKERWRSVFHYTCCAIFTAAILATASRGGAVALAFTLVITLWSNKGLGLKKLTTIIVMIFALAMAIAYSPSTSIGRILHVVDQIQNRDLTNRGAIWAKALDQYFNSPFIGIGAGACPAALAQFGEAAVAHSTLLSIMAQLGTVGILGYAALLFVTYLGIRKMPPEWRKCWTAVLVGYFIGTLTLSWDYRKPTWWIFSMMAACAIVTVPKMKQSFVTLGQRVGLQRLG